MQIITVCIRLSVARANMKVFVLFSIFAVIYGQSNIPQNVAVQCFTSSSTCDAASLDVTRSNMLTGAANEHNLCCYNTTGSPLTDQSTTYFRLGTGECRSCLDESVSNTIAFNCFDNQPAGTCTLPQDSVDDHVSSDGGVRNTCCDGENAMTNFQSQTDPSAPCMSCYDIGSSTGGPAMGNDPHFFLPLANGDNMCFSVQGEPDFAFNLINDKHIQLNGQFVLPAEEESHTISNVSTFIGSLGLLVTSPKTGNTVAIKISAVDHSVLVGNSLTIVKDTPVTVNVSDALTIDVDTKIQASRLKDESAWLYINTNAGFGLKVRFYKKHVDLFLTKTSGLTKAAHGLIGQFLAVDVKIDADYNIMKLGDRKPISVKKGKAWPFLGISDQCWYGVSTDNQGTGIIDGVYTDYIVRHLVPLKK